MTETFASIGRDCFFALQPHIGRFPLTSSLLPLSVFLKFVFVSGARQYSKKSFPGMLMFAGCSCFLPKVAGIGLKSEGRTTTVVFCEAGGVAVG
jgi:hypothetical protein